VVISYESIDSHGGGYRENYTYDEQGLLIKEVSIFPMYFYENIYSYNSKGQKILEERFQDGVLRDRIFREYDTRGNLVLRKSITVKGIPAFQSIYIYDEKNREKAYLFFEKDKKY